jgi:deoxyhypusine synthase
MSTVLTDAVTLKADQEPTTDAVFVKSVEMPPGCVLIKGYDFNQGVDHNALLESFLTSGFQASNFGMAVEEINRMRAWSLADEPVAEDEDEELKDPEARKKVKTTIFLGYTSNMASCGVRETIRYLCQHKMVQAIVATAGGVEEDIIKCLAPTYLGSRNPLHPGVASGFELDGKTLRQQVSYRQLSALRHWQACGCIATQQLAARRQT